jgi:hypothetical protein
MKIDIIPGGVCKKGALHGREVKPGGERAGAGRPDPLR